MLQQAIKKNDQNSIETQTTKLDTQKVIIVAQEQSEKFLNLDTNKTSVNKVDINQVADEFEINLNQKTSKAERTIDLYTASLLKIVIILFFLLFFLIN